MPAILVIIVHYSGLADTLECINSLKKAGFKKKEVVIINNNSSDFNKKAIFAIFPHINIINSPKNVGFSGGNNLGLKYGIKADYKHFILLNNDTIVNTDFKTNLIKAIQTLPEDCIFSPKIYFAKGYEFHQEKYKKSEQGKVIWYAGGLIDWQNVYASHRGVDEVDNNKYILRVKTDFATGCCMIISRAVIKQVGFFDDRYFLYFEDLDFCQRAKKKNIKIYYEPKLYLWHKNAVSSEGAGGATSYYYQTRNRFIFALKYASLKTKIIILRQAFSFLLAKDKTKQKAALDFLFLKRGIRT